MKSELLRDSEKLPGDDERLMALLALTVQELPPAPPKVEASAAAPDAEERFQRLDSDPVALEAYLRRGMRAPGPSTSRWRAIGETLSAWFAPPAARFAMAAGLVLLFGLVSLVQWQSLVTIVEDSYATVDLSMPAGGLVLPWERQGNVQGFSAITGNDSASGRAFAYGLLRGRARLSGLPVPAAEQEGPLDSDYVALGEWNVLLWSASESGRDYGSEFWQAQLRVARRLDTALKTENEGTLGAHLRTTELAIAAMATAPDRRSARQLSNELLRFREAFSPLDAAAVPTQ